MKSVSENVVRGSNPIVFVVSIQIEKKFESISTPFFWQLAFAIILLYRFNFFQIKPKSGETLVEIGYNLVSCVHFDHA